MAASANTLERLADRGARLIRSTFASYLDEFRAISRMATARFEARDWQSQACDSLDRLDLYPRSVTDAAARLRELLGNLVSSRALWVEIKSAFPRTADDLNNELAKTFYNSLTRRIFATVGVDSRIEFASLDLVIRDWKPEPQILRRYSASGPGEATFSKILDDYRFTVDYRDIGRDARLVSQRVERRLKTEFGSTRIDAVELLRPVFYRRKAAYFIGRVFSGEHVLPLILVLRNSRHGVFVDAVLMRESEVSILFSFTRSYFHVETECPRKLIVFLKAIIPLKPVSDLYSALGYNKHGKTELYRSLQRHLKRTTDRFIFASGDPGMVMLVFTLPSYDRVFKVIRDNFRFPKTTSPREVMERYRLVYKRDRVGRLVEAQRFLKLEFRMDRFEPELLDELQREASRTVKQEGEFLVFEHLYTERKVTPLNIYIREENDELTCKAVLDYGAAIKELAAANIFPGDFLLKNFGVTRHGRVVFYDYDELCLLTDCRFRRLPPSRIPEDELEAEPWFAVAENDVFPEEFRRFLGLPAHLLGVFEEHHGDLFTPKFWKDLQRMHRAGAIPTFFPYPRSEQLQLKDYA